MTGVVRPEVQIAGPMLVDALKTFSTAADHAFANLGHPTTCGGCGRPRYTHPGSQRASGSSGNERTAQGKNG